MTKVKTRGVYWFLLAVFMVLFMASTVYVLCDMQRDMVQKEGRIRNHEIVNMGLGVELYRLRNELAETKIRLRNAEMGLAKVEEAFMAVAAVSLKSSGRLSVAEQNIDAIWVELLYAAKALGKCCDPWGTEEK